MAVKRAKTSRRSTTGASATPATTKRPAARKAASGATPPTKRRAGASAAGKVKAKKTAVAKAGVKKPAVAKGPHKTAPAARPKAAQGGVVKVVEGALDEMKAVNVAVLNVHKLTDITDTMIIASGNSDRHVRSIADRVIEHAKKAGFRPMGVEGERDGEWVLVDLQDVIVHIMLPRVREFYRLESLWDVSAARREVAGGGA